MGSSNTDVLTDVTMPQMGVSVAEGTIVAWRVEVGDRIAADETICDISTDKIDTEVPSPVSGVVAELLATVDETVAVGTVIARIAQTGAADGVLGVQRCREAPGRRRRRTAARRRPRPRRPPPATAAIPPWYSGSLPSTASTCQR